MGIIIQLLVFSISLTIHVEVAAAIGASPPPVRRRPPTAGSPIPLRIPPNSDSDTSKLTLSRSANSVPQTFLNCPVSCKCRWNADSLFVEGCNKDVSHDSLNALIQKHQGVTSLSLISSSLSKIPDAVYSLRHLLSLNLSHNSLTKAELNCPHVEGHLEALENNSFRKRGFPGSITNLTLSYNLIEKVRLNLDHAHKRLQFIALDNNRITHVKIELHSKFHSLKELDLQSNNLPHLDIWALQLWESGVTINLEKNNISNFIKHSSWKFHCDARPKGLLNLAHNNISHLMDIFEGWRIEGYHTDMTCFLKQSHAIRIEGNPLNCDCRDYNIYNILKSEQILHAFNHQLLCYLPPSLRGKNMLDLQPDMLVCDIHKNCPNRCKCQQIPYLLKMLVNCENCNLTELPLVIPGMLPKYTYDLNFVGNLLEGIEQDSFVNNYFSHTSWARFSYNQIDFVMYSVIEALLNAKLVFLDNNGLRYLPPGVGSLNMTTSPMKLHLAHNPFYCDCLIHDTWEFVHSMKQRVIDKDQMICSKPANMDGYKLMQEKPGPFQCPTEPRGWYYFLFFMAVFTVIVWILIVFIPIVIIYKQRLLLWTRYKKHWFNRDECRGEFKEFDIFLCYAEVDKAFAMNTVFNWLESHGYKVAHHKANYMVGKSIAKNIYECVRKSKRTLCILTTAFTRSDWCLLEFCTALHIDKQQKTQRLIGIQMEALVEDPTGQIELDPRFSWFIPEQRCLAVGDPLLWEKLMYMLPLMKMGYRMMDGRLQVPEYIPYTTPAKKLKASASGKKAAVKAGDKTTGCGQFKRKCIQSADEELLIPEL